MQIPWIAVAALAPVLQLAVSIDPVPGRVAVANRGDGTVSIVDATTDTVTTTLTLPGALPAEPMYVVFAPRSGRLFVGDRANDQVVAYDARDLSVIGSVAVGGGVFHMAMDGRERQMWVVGDEDRALTVFDPNSLDLLHTVPIPSDLAASAAKPHDVSLEPAGRRAFVTFFSVPGPDLVVSFSTATFAELGRRGTVESPHVLAGRDLPLALVTGSDAVEVLHRRTLEALASIPATGAHGTVLGRSQRFFYTTNTAGGGPAGIVTIDLESRAVVGTLDTPDGTPHNVAVTLDGRKLYCTHSTGTGTSVSVYRLDPVTGLPALDTVVPTGVNPYGIAAMR